MNTMMRFVVVLSLSTIVCGCWERHKITGLGDIKLGDKTTAKGTSYKKRFMFFDQVGWNSTPKSLKRYSVYYYSRREPGFVSVYSSGLTEEELVTDVKSEVERLVILLERKYTTCHTLHFRYKDKMVPKTFIDSVSDCFCTQYGVFGSVFDENWFMVFQADEEDRYIGVFVAEYRDKKRKEDLGWNTQPQNEKPPLRSMRVLLVAWDKQLWDRCMEERRQLTLDGL